MPMAREGHCVFRPRLAGDMRKRLRKADGGTLVITLWGQRLGIFGCNSNRRRKSIRWTLRHSPTALVMVF